MPSDSSQATTSTEMTIRKSWKEFRESGLLWWTNRMLHLFGWAIVLVADEVNENDYTITDAYPARVKFRGFDTASETRGFRNLSLYMARFSPTLEEEANQD